MRAVNRNRKGSMPKITREAYKSVKRGDRQQFEEFCKTLYGYGFEDGRESVPGADIEDVIAAIASTRGIGDVILKRIRESIEGSFQT